MMRILRSTFVPFVVGAFVVASAPRDFAQVVVPPGASLDVQAPVAPTPVRIDGRVHLAYELHITNVRTTDVTLTRIEARCGDRDRPPLAVYESEKLRTRLARAGVRPASGDSVDVRVIPPGGRAVFFAWMPLDDAGACASGIRHALSLVVGMGSADAATIEAPPLAVRRDVPVVLGPPLRGGPWAAVYDPALAGGHRRALFAIDGRARIPARFAIDWIRLGDDGRAVRGDVAVLANFYGYGADVLAVADAVVAAAVDGVPEPTRPVTFDNAAGNFVALNLGGGRFAFYEHLRPQSIRVHVGDRVRSGQVIAALGASGSVSSGPHLHFHVADAPSSLGAEGLPFVFGSFQLAGAFESLAAFAAGEPWVPLAGGRATRRLEMPGPQMVVWF